MDFSDKVLVTGVAGFIGSWLSEELTKKGYEVVGADNFQGGDISNVSRDIRFIKVDLTDPVKVEDLFKREQFGMIFHTAASAREGLSQFSPRLIAQTNYYLSMNVIEQSIKYGVNKFIYFSSMSVYGNSEPPFKETMRRNPADVYAVSKTATEKSLEILADVHEFRYTIIRPYCVFGPRQYLADKYRNVIAIFMNSIMRGEPIWIFGDGTQKRRFSYIEDCVPAYVACAEKADGEIVNIGGSEEITINELADRVCTAMGKPDHQRIHVADRPKEVKYAYCDNSKSVCLLGYKEIFGMNRGIDKMAAWARNKGPQEWTSEKPAIINEKTPEVWK